MLHQVGTCKPLNTLYRGTRRCHGTDVGRTSSCSKAHRPAVTAQPGMSWTGARQQQLPGEYEQVPTTVVKVSASWRGLQADSQQLIASDLKVFMVLLWLPLACLQFAATRFLQDSAHWLAVDTYGNLFYTDAKAGRRLGKLSMTLRGRSCTFCTCRLVRFQ